jgi:hypothetical protein
MRAREFIPEVVDINRAPDTQWSRRPDLDTYRGRGVEVGQWKDTTGADVSSQFRKDFKGDPGKTDVKFSRTDASGSPTMGISGTAGGKSSKILGGVVNNIKTFLDKILNLKRLGLPGSAMTPTREATSSPNDLDMARPGMSSCFSHTLKGPTGFLSASLNESIRPLHLIILSASSGWQGF